MNRKTRIIPLALAALLGGGLTACSSAADTANDNLSQAAENFEVPRRIVGINGITDQVLFSVEGFCSYEVADDGKTFEVICLVDRANDEVERTTLHLSDNVTFVSTQMGGVEVDLFRPRVIFRPRDDHPGLRPLHQRQRLTMSDCPEVELLEFVVEAANQISLLAEMWASLTMDTPEDQALHDRMVALTLQKVTAIRGTVTALRAAQGGQK